MVRENRICPKAYRKVGLKYPPYDKHYDPTFSYVHVKTDIDGWADASVYLPADYDLVILKVEGKNPYFGWFSGTTWDGLKHKEGDKVISWKREQS
jgi:hypothetical protein